MVWASPSSPLLARQVTEPVSFAVKSRCLDLRASPTSSYYVTLVKLLDTMSLSFLVFKVGIIIATLFKTVLGVTN